MDNKKCFYLVEGECEEKLVKALKEKPALIHPGSVKKFNIIQNTIPSSKLMSFDPGSMVVLVFDTDIEITEYLKKNIRMLKDFCLRVEILTIAQVLNFEDEIVRSTDVDKAQDLTKSDSISDFKRSVNRMKDTEFRQALKRHKFDLSKLWIKRPPKIYSFINQQAESIKVKDAR